MNTATAAKLLGISQSTLKRWIKELDLDMNRNELGHYDIQDEDISVLKQVKKQIQNGTFLQDVTISRNKVRKGKTAILLKESTADILVQRMNDLEKKLNEKADKVVSYQLLTHRKEIEDLENEINRLNTHVELLEKKLAETESKDISNNNANSYKINKKRNLFSTLFNF
ncbi:chromosome segregation protein [Heyndrickxia shackletonii]|uniref:Chromosome-anchoring protein RacA n=1 Tax=Heyndrickxia shackletonii TaxID=157838 RepID=A0A0Q3WTI5_9BACI|nr:MerR family transcriptional regulator [Heyndrickxia shackletonii]KQL51501.1 chromosome segregation protein [Heyndrickxia shackletonii]MBB2482310.1 MerR family transcriptional regulator [Bacillus sp. APMAM]NEZ01104.1 MerR family transcriptional regulator [Heyndrickxia shackletonii]RTZ54300.1 MerR family transcriptional regulator [Bacillus sp. SAJ1]